jgi:hypothetical protein
MGRPKKAETKEVVSIRLTNKIKAKIIKGHGSVQNYFERMLMLDGYLEDPDDVLSMLTADLKKCKTTEQY